MGKLLTIFNRGLRLALFSALVLVLLQNARAQLVWTRYAKACEGGVVNDYAYCEFEEGHHLLFSVCMANGLFHKEYQYQSANTWDNSNPWIEHLPARTCYGVDALTTGSGNDHAHYVIVATENDGIFRGIYTAGNQTFSGWHENTEKPYGHTMHWEDVSFWDNTNHEEYFACGWELVDESGENMKVYRWDNAGNDWEKVNDPNPINLKNFYRDIGNDKKIYGIGTDGIWHSDTSSYIGTWTNLTDDILTTPENYEGVTGFYQASADIIYIIAKNDSGEHPIWEIWKYDMSSENSGNIATFDPEENIDEMTALFTGEPVSGLIVDNYETNKYKIWVGTNKYGPLYCHVNPPATSWTQICVPNNDDVGGWVERSMFQDPKEAPGAFFYGVWQGGMYHYDGSDWTKLNTGLTGGYGVGSFGGYYEHHTGDDDYLLAATYQHGLYIMDATAPANPPFSAIGNAAGTVNAQAWYAKSYNDIVQGPEASELIYYAGCRPYTQFSLTSSDVLFGGIYKIDHDNNTCASVSDWDNDGTVDDKAWDVCRMIADVNDDIYVCTGEAGINQYNGGVPNRHMIRRASLSGGNLVWDTNDVLSFTGSVGGVAECRGFLAIDAYPCGENSDHVVISGLGNRWNAGIGYVNANTIGRVYGPVHDDYNSSEYRLARNENMYSVFDVEAVDRIESTNYTNDYVVWVSTANPQPQNNPQVLFVDGNIYAIEVKSDEPYEIVNDRTPSLTGYGYNALYYHLYAENLHLLAAIAVGFNASNIYESRFLVGVIDPNDNSEIRWRDKGTITIDDPESIYDSHPIVHEILGAEQGDHSLTFYINAQHTLEYHFEHSSLDLEGGTWNWISANYYQCFDSLSTIMVTCDSLTEMRDQYGNRYRPNDNPPVDSIYVWTPLKGYGIRTSGNDEFESFGNPIPADTTIMLYPAPQDSSWI